MNDARLLSVLRTIALLSPLAACERAQSPSPTTPSPTTTPAPTWRGTPPNSELQGVVSQQTPTSEPCPEAIPLEGSACTRPSNASGCRYSGLYCHCNNLRQWHCAHPQRGPLPPPDLAV